ncbi:hypothetical protein MAR_032267 [Mya arenaria]|uniref:Uncharacterized protein n=1 Tax=Mya arenaria TaxID=6604 RepID=A0ABY7F656_MYAAR|nr:hypothetical protein MAR_032267 [Mya arenaria]
MAQYHVPDPEELIECRPANKREENQLKGCTDTPAYKNLEILNQEDWDEEMNLYAQTSSLDKQGNSSLRLPRTAPMVAMATEPKAVPPVQPAYAYALAQGRGRGIQTMNGVTPNGTVNIKKLLYVFFLPLIDHHMEYELV